MEILKFIGIVLLVAIGCAGIIAIATAIIWVRLMSQYENKVEREVDRRLRGTVIRSRFNVRPVVIDDTSGVDEETQMCVSEWDSD